MDARFNRVYRDDAGQALILVVIVSLLVLGALAVATSVTVGSLGLSSQYNRSSQASLASLSGLNALRAIMKKATLYSDLPCYHQASPDTGTPGIPGSASSYSVWVQYYSATGVDHCTGSIGSVSFTKGNPTAATLTSTGTNPRGSQTVMQEDVAISPSNNNSQVFGNSIFTVNGNQTFAGGAEIYENGAANEPANLYIGPGGTLDCTAAITVEGSLLSYATAGVSLPNCYIDGNVTANGPVTMQSDSTVGLSSCETYATPCGNVIAYGGGIDLGPKGTAQIYGNATATGGDILLGPKGSEQIDGNADASGSITVSAGKILGTQTKNDSVLASESIPPQLTFPTSPALTDWESAGWTVIQIPSVQYPYCENLTNGTTTTQSYFQDLSSGANDPFMTEISTITSKTVIYAPSCDVTYDRAHTFDLNADVVLDVGQLTLSGENIFNATGLSGTTTYHNFSIFAGEDEPCSPSRTDVSFANGTVFPVPTPPSTSTTLNVLLYAQGVVSIVGDPSMNGQILACGGFSGTNVQLYFTPSAALTLPWPGGTSGNLTTSVLDKFLPKG